MVDFEESAHDITAEPEYVDANEAIENTETARREASEVKNDGTKQAYNDALNRQRDASENLSNKILERMSTEPIPATDFNIFRDAMNFISSLNPFNFDNPTAADGQNLLNTLNQKSTPVVDNALNTTIRGGIDAINRNASENSSPEQNSRARDIDSQTNKTAQKISDAQKTQDAQTAADALRDLAETKKKMDDLLEENNKLKEKIKAKSGEKGWTSYKLLKWLSGLAALIGAGVGVGYLLLKLYADAETGCYKFDGITQLKLPCPTDRDHQEWCSCGDEDNIIYQPNKPTKCGTDEPLYNYPFCCGGINPKPYTPLCSDPTGGLKPGEKGYIYYGFVLVEPGDVLKKLVDSALDAFDSALSSIWNIIKWISIAIGIIFVLFIAIKFTFMIIDSRKKVKSK